MYTRCVTVESTDTQMNDIRMTYLPAVVHYVRAPHAFIWRYYATEHHTTQREQASEKPNARCSSAKRIETKTIIIMIICTNKCRFSTNSLLKLKDSFFCVNDNQHKTYNRLKNITFRIICVYRVHFIHRTTGIDGESKERRLFVLCMFISTNTTRWNTVLMINRYVRQTISIETLQSSSYKCL